MATLLLPDPLPTPREDAERLRKAVQGWGTDEKGLISVLAHRNADQRNQIREAYQDIYHEDLIKRLESELSGDFERAVYRWILDPVDRDAVLAHIALKSSNPDYKVITEIACGLSPDELLAVKRAYQKRYNSSLEEDVASHTTGDIRKILVGLVSTYRYNGNEVRENLASSEANILNYAIEGKEFGNEEMIRVLTTRSKTQLNATFNRFKDTHGTSLTKRLLGDPSDEFLSVLRSVVRCVGYPTKYFEKVIRNALNQVGTNEDALTRVIVRHAEKDMREIKELYYKRNSVPLDQAIAKKTSGDYEAFILTLLGTEGY